MADNDQPDIPADEFKTWLTPAQALAELKSLGPKAATDQIKLRLDQGLLRSVAETAVRARKQISLVEIASATWCRIDNSLYADDFWKTAQITIYIGAHVGYRSSNDSLHLFGIRFDPAGIRRIAPSPAQTPVPEKTVVEPPPPVVATPTPETKPPVAAAALRAWSDVYQRFYPSDEYALPHALESAQGMFHDKAVSRDAVRDVLPARKSGPKKRQTPQK